MSALSSQIAEARLQDLIEEFDGDYWAALTEFEGPSDDCGYRYDNDRVMWKWIPGFSNYEISSDGRVRSYVKPNNPIDLKPWHSSYGYPYVQLTSDTGERHKFTVHSLVANGFCYNPDPENYNVVRHRNDNPTDNHWSNLEFGTAAMNHQDMVDHDRDFKIPVYCYENNTVYKSGAACAEALGICKASVTNACKGKIGYCDGYHICYLKDKDTKLANLDEWLDDSRSKGYKKVRATNIETGDSYIFESRKAASNALGIPNCGISSVISGYIKQTHGWAFEDLS